MRVARDNWLCLQSSGPLKKMPNDKIPMPKKIQMLKCQMLSANHIMLWILDFDIYLTFEL
jgi:hypothetical protein